MQPLQNHRHPDRFDRILFIELLGGIGDVLIALPAMQAIGRSHPQAHLTVLTFAPGAELLEHDLWIDEVVIAAADEARQTVEALLAQRSFDLMITDTTYDGIAELLQTRDATRVVTNLWQSPPDDQRVGDRFLQILQAEKLITPDSIAPPQLYLTAPELAAAQTALGTIARPLVLLYPDAGMPIKRWQPDRFIQVGRALQQSGATIRVPIGSDLDSASQIAAGIGGTAQPWQRGTIRELAATIAHADLFIGADTGTARIAAALNVPTITLFGPSWHGRYGQPAPHVNLQGCPNCPERLPKNFTQQFCWYSGNCPFDGWQTCLEAIDPQAVVAAARSLLHPTAPPSPVTALPTWSSVRNLLVMRLDNIGDVIMTSPALRALKENLPEARLTLMASPGGALVAPLLPWVDEVLPWRALWQDLGRLPFDSDREWQLIDILKSHGFDAAIIFTSFSQSPHPPALICALAGIPLRLGESKEDGGSSLTTAVPPAPNEMHQVDRNLRLLEAIGFPIADRALSLQIPDVRSPVSSPYLLLTPWTSCQSRNYDDTRFATAARQLAEITGSPVVVTGVAKDRDRSEALLKILGDWAIDRIGQTTLPELAALIARAQLVLTNNTSTMHIADATRTPMVVMFAGTELECQWQPRSTQFQLLRRPTACSPCYAFTCPYSLECLDIAPEQIVAAGLGLLDRPIPQIDQISNGLR
jgi:ADP-heptose:LPS heptosyltransferase